jgi:acetoin utilization deacetylase AcuC-like enzyme/GNAT superfamily N-acetyltransferase
MFGIRRVWDDVLPVNRQALDGVRALLAERFDGVSARDVQRVHERLRNPFVEGLRPIIYVAEGRAHKVQGFAAVLHDPELDFAMLEYVAAGKLSAGRGVGSALYEVVRAEAKQLGCRGLFFECLPDDLPDDAPAQLRRDNAARLRFYEAWHAVPILGTEYTLPTDPTDDSPMPYLVADRLGSKEPLEGKWLRRVIRSILEKKYAALCSPEYVDRVVKSVPVGDVELRPLRYRKAEAPVPAEAVALAAVKVPMVVNDKHQIHHVRERGYVESPVRVASLLKTLDPTGWFQHREPRHFAQRHLTAVHDPALVGYLERACRDVAEDKSLYPYIFPVRNRTRPPRERSVLSGYYCIDTFTPIHRNAYPAARRAVDCALTAANEVLEGARVAYALVRPPGHHAETGFFGGFCYFNNAAVAAHFLTPHGKVAILDIDYHHGNGQQEIFYRRADVLTLSIHGDPSFAYPYYTGFEDEVGEGDGAGFNANFALPEKLDGAGFRRTLRRALERVREFEPTFLVVALGLDPAKGDPTGTWSLVAEDFRRNGELIAGLELPTLVVQEGGYRTQTLGQNARSFFQGLLRR